MKHRRFRTGYWRVHWYRLEGNGLPWTATDLQFTARGRTAGRPTEMVISSVRNGTRKRGCNLERRGEE